MKKEGRLWFNQSKAALLENLARKENVVVTMMVLMNLVIPTTTEMKTKMGWTVVMEKKKSRDETFVAIFSCWSLLLLLLVLYSPSQFHHLQTCNPSIFSHLPILPVLLWNPLLLPPNICKFIHNFIIRKEQMTMLYL